MIGEIDVAGIFLSPLLPCLLVAFLARLLVSWAIGIAGFYRIVWNRPLFDLSLFLVLLGVAFTSLRLLTAS
jgi:GH15 family glucan-1,4-alpha-glucosidase